MAFALFRFLRKTDNLGVGTGALGLERPQGVKPDSVYGPRYNVRGTLRTQAPAFVKIGANVLPVSLLGTTGIAKPREPLTLQQLAQYGEPGR